MSVKWQVGSVVVAIKDNAFANTGDKGLVIGHGIKREPIVIFSAGHVRTMPPAIKKVYAEVSVDERFTSYALENYFTLKRDYHSGLFDSVFIPFPAFR